MMSQLISACIFLSGLLPLYFIVAVFPAAAPAIVSLRVAYFRGFIYHPLTFSSDTFYSMRLLFSLPFGTRLSSPAALDIPTIYFFPEVLHSSVTSVLELDRVVTPPPPPFPSRQLLAPHTTTRYATPLQTAATRSQRLRRLPER